MLKKSNTAKRKKKSWNFVLKLFWVSLFVYVWFFFFVLFFYVLWSRVVAVMAVEATVGGTNPTPVSGQLDSQIALIVLSLITNYYTLQKDLNFIFFLTLINCIGLYLTYVKRARERGMRGGYLLKFIKTGQTS